MFSICHVQLFVYIMGIPEVVEGNPFVHHFIMARWQFRKLRSKMKLFSSVILYILLILKVRAEDQSNDKVEEESNHDQPTVMVAILVRNKAHVLPYFFHYLEKQDYPKDRMSIWWVAVQLVFYYFV